MRDADPRHGAACPRGGIEPVAVVAPECGNLDPWSVETMFKKSRADYPPGLLAIYDNGGRTTDRYMVVFTPYNCFGGLRFPTLTMSANPTHPQGVGLRGESTSRPTLAPGERVVGLGDLPEECRRCVEDDLRQREVECPRCGGLGPELIAAGPHAGERCRVCVSH